MLSLVPVRPVARECRSFGWEVRYGTWNLEDVIAHGEGSKPVTVLDGNGDVGIAYVSCEHRAKTRAGRRMIGSAWSSFPVSIKSRKVAQWQMFRIGRVLRKLIARKMERYLAEYEREQKP